MIPLPHQTRLYISSLDALAVFAGHLADFLRPGDVVALNGTLGAGKTTLIQHLGRALGFQEAVTSPTFVLMHEYASGRYPVLHVDLYRLGPENAEALSEELFETIDAGTSLVLVEWACYGPFLDPAITVALELSFSDVDGPVADADVPVDASATNPEELPRQIVLSANRPLPDVFGVNND
jgi:tRNA threonylcarbamoyladenosine biosynthesis protein TsaE